MVKWKLVVLLAAMVLSAALLIKFRDAWSLLPLKTENAYTDIFHVTTDSDGSMYTISNSKSTLEKVNKYGLLVYSVPAGEYARPNTLRLFNSIAADAEGNAYVLVTVLDSGGLAVIGEQIMKISPDGSETVVMYDAVYAPAEHLLRVGKIQDLSAKEGYVYFFRVERESALLLRLPAQSDADAKGTPETVATIHVPPDAYLNELAWSGAGAIFYTTKRGALYSAANAAAPLYPQTEEPLLNFPAGIAADGQSRVYFIDYYESAIKRVDVRQPGHPVETWITKDMLAKRFPSQAWSDFTQVSVSDEGMIAAVSGRLIQLNPDGSIAAVKEGYRYSRTVVCARVAYWAGIIMLGMLAVATVRFIYVHVLRRKVSLLFKQLALIIPVVMLCMVGLSYSVYTSFADKIRDQMLHQLKLMVDNSKLLVDGGRLERLHSPRDYMNDDYKAIKSRLNGMFSSAYEQGDGLYNTIYRYMDGRLYIMMDDDDSVMMFRPFPLNESNLLVLEKGQTVTGEWRDAKGHWLFALGPLYNDRGEIIGIYETGKDMIRVNESNLSIMGDILGIIAICAAILVMVITGMTAYLLHSIRKLRRSVNLIAGGEWDVRVQIHTRDEVEELGERFNMMASSIRQYIQEVTRLNVSYARFVPQQMLKLLGKSHMTQIRLGEQANRVMAVLVCEVRHFPELSGRLTTEGNFHFINGFLKTFGPVIRDCGGFTSRYLGPGMLTLFPNDAMDAIKAAVLLRSTLESYNAEHDPIDIGIAVHCGEIMIGMIGEEQRMEGSVVSNDVQLTMELERLSDKLGVHILLTEAAFRSAQEMTRWRHRKLGAFQLKDGGQTVELYDLYEADPETIRRLKEETRQQFEEAVELFRNGRFHDARQAFVTVVKKNRYDLAAKQYFFACDRYFQEGVSADWNYALHIS
ncbi:hypothetical protein PAESOLCIP111_03968 [Paenibacillus solanacearum]|uniref:HAMP domain-containing protein n=1 Tax=Paenibacillus solanacearum TaxID=2048548 RepID=A0A916K3U7_9BACL|nr:hypothetical protein PAESOLCIP111_03968 [Paenibacillus solanacearum]